MDLMLATISFSPATLISPQINTTFTSEPNGTSPSWNRGTDIPLPITYSTDPDFYFPAPFNLVALDARDVNGGDATFQFGGSVIDFCFPPLR